ncbi:hypothetical protein [Amycolatopsis samaneae]|uniref:ABC transporter permease n=1 Tax=Amycolatopsis samaneae TaxID=664691 RepID=A0ABW5GPZ9_9PSEU
MSARVLGIELRRSVALLAGAVIVAAGLAVAFMMFQKDTSLGQWTAYAGLMRYLLEILCPLAIGAGAWQGRRERRSGMTELTATVSRPAWQRVLPVSGAMAITVVVGYAVVFVAGVVQVAGNTTYQHLGWLPIPLVGALALIASGWLGLGIGTLLPSAITAPVLVAGSLMGLIALRVLVGGKAALLSPELGGVLSDHFVAPAPRVTIAQVIWFAALAVTGIVLATGIGRRRLFALLPVALGLAVALPLLPATREATYVADPGAAEPVCTADLPRVCVGKAHANALQPLVGPAREALRLLAPLPGAPTSVAENTRDTYMTSQVKPQPSDVLLVSLPTYWLDNRSRLSMTEEEALSELLLGAGTTPCVRYHEDPNPAELEQYRRELDARHLAAGLLLGKPLRTFGSEDKAMWPALQALSPEEKHRRLGALRTAGLSCSGDLMEILTGSGAR